MTPKELAQAYVATVNGKRPNGWGQFCHPTLGRSDYMMWRLWHMVGMNTDERDRLIREAFIEARGGANDTAKV
jgi:hypothetical protein